MSLSEELEKKILDIKSVPDSENKLFEDLLKTPELKKLVEEIIESRLRSRGINFLKLK